MISYREWESIRDPEACGYGRIMVNRWYKMRVCVDSLRDQAKGGGQKTDKNI